VAKGRAQGGDEGEDGKTRCTDREYEDRVAAAQQLMLCGYTDRRTAVTLADTHKVSIRQAHRYIEDAKARWQQAAKARTDRTEEERLAEHVERFAMLVQLCVAGGNLKTAVTASERLAQIDGFLSTKVQHSGKVGLDLNPEVDEAAAEVLRARGWAPPEPPADPPSE